MLMPSFASEPRIMKVPVDLCQMWGWTFTTTFRITNDL